jgi:hypothetical protein
MLIQKRRFVSKTLIRHFEKKKRRKNVEETFLYSAAVVNPKVDNYTKTKNQEKKCFFDGK